MIARDFNFVFINFFILNRINKQWLTIIFLLLVAVWIANAQQSGLGGTQSPPEAAEGQGSPLSPIINWGSCPQLEPNENEKREKAEIIKVCLERIPLPSNITQQSVEIHRAEVAKCALQREGWFNEHGEYKYEKADGEIRKKQLNSAIEQQILTQHTQCQQEAQDKFPKLDEVIAQIQLYQACMDYHISKVCGITIMNAPPKQP